MRCFCLLAILIATHCQLALADDIPSLIGSIRADTFSTLFGSQIVPLGDQNGDNSDDILIWAFDRSAYLFYGGDPFDSVADLQFDSIGNRNTNIGDINGDGYDELALSGTSFFGIRINLYYGGPDIDTARDLWFGDDSLRAIGYTARGHDLDNNGLDDIVCWPPYEQDAVLLFDLGSDSDSLPDLLIEPDFDAGNNPIFGEQIVTGDFNGDGATDLAASLRFGVTQQINGSVHLYWGGILFDTLPDLVFSRSLPFEIGKNSYGQILTNAGDINGDGFADLYIASFNSDDSVATIYFGGPAIDTTPDLLIPEFFPVVKPGGDLNSDGYNDWVASRTGLGQYGHVKVYYGGPELDSVADITVRGIDVPGYQEQFGMECAGIGDFNGDSIDDFAVAAVDAYQYGIVFIFSGPGAPTDVPIEHDPEIPAGFSLSHNYPNPFNPATTIEFALPRRARTKLAVYNVLGEEVVTLVDKELAAGGYRVRWDGTDRRGRAVASGAYFYKLTAGQFTQTRKMALVR